MRRGGLGRHRTKGILYSAPVSLLMDGIFYAGGVMENSSIVLLIMLVAIVIVECTLVLTRRREAAGKA
jgi:hypothetical protein